MMREEWRPVVGYKGWYDVSNLGRVRRIKQVVGTFSGRIIKGSVSSFGYVKVRLSNDVKFHDYCMHRIVSEAFIGKCSDGKQVNHIDGNKANNLADNLEYVTPSENLIHSYRIGSHVPLRGETHGRSKLTEENVREIRRLLVKESQHVIARLFNVSQSTISDISTGNNWGWLDA